MAENDGKIYITISDRRFGSNVAEADAQNKSDKKKDKESEFGSWVVHQFFSLVKTQALNNVNFAISNIGNFTGDYQSQRDAQTAMSVINELMGFGTAVVAGAKIGGVPGAIVATTVYGINKAISTVQTYQLINLQQKQTNHTINQLQNRSGLNTRLDGSRGTEN